MTEDSNHKKISTEEQTSENINKDVNQSSKQFKEKTSRSTADSNNKLPIILSTIALACGIYSVSITSNLNNNSGSNNQSFNKDSNSANFTEGSIASVANSVSKSVVSIVTSTNQRSFFSGESSSQTAAGTGFILSSDGYIATNKHVVSGATKIGVVLHDGTAYEDVELIGTDPLNDFAIIKIKNVDNLSPAKLGDSKTGGNSGGPLVNGAGEVIGINTAYASQGNNVGFAIPISCVKGIIKNVLENKSFARAVIGVRYVNLTPSIAKEKNLNVTQGALISSNRNNRAVIQGSAGDKAGLKENDVITQVNGINIGDAGSLASLIGEYSVGDTVKLTISRNQKTEIIELTLEAYK